MSWPLKNRNRAVRLRGCIFPVPPTENHKGLGVDFRSRWNGRAVEAKGEILNLFSQRRLIMKGPEKEASATRVISQPQMLDKSKEAGSLQDDIQKGRSDYWEEKAYLFFSKVPEYSPGLPVHALMHY
ncbi:hypothetical protein AB1E18_004052 [Capra hircus]